MSLVRRWGCRDCGAVLFTGVDAWYRAYAPQLRRLVGRFAADRGVPQSALDPEDVVHDVFELLHTRLGDDVRNPAGWLRTVAERYVARAHGELHRSSGSDPEDHLTGLPAERRWSSLARTAALETMVDYHAALVAIAALADRQRAAVYLQRIHGMSNGEIAELWGIAAATVSVHTHRGVRSVREALGDELDQVRIGRRRKASLRFLMRGEHREHTAMVAPKGAAWTWCPCWRSPPKQGSCADERPSLLKLEIARSSGDEGDPAVADVMFPPGPPAQD